MSAVCVALSPMILRTRLQWLLAGSTAVFTLAAFFSAFTGDDSPSASTQTTTTTAEEVTTTTAAPKTYIVNPGDSLFSIAEQFGVDLNELVELNGIVDVDKINAGDELKLPAPTTTTTTESTTTTVAETSTTS